MLRLTLVTTLACVSCTFDTSTSGLVGDDNGLARRADAASDNEPSPSSADAGLANDGSTISKPGDAAGCPTVLGYIAIAGTCHRQSSTGADWLTAELDCENDIAGAHLVIVDDATELAALPNDVWIGLSERTTNGVFVTVTNQPPPFTSWAAGEPVTGGGLCVESRPDGWHDDGCQEGKSFVCEYDGIDAVPAAYGN